MDLLSKLFETREDDFDFGTPHKPTITEPEIIDKSNQREAVNAFTPIFATTAPVNAPSDPNVRVREPQNPLTRHRQRAGLSQIELAKQSGVGLDTIKRLENGSSDPHLSTLRKLAQTLQTQIDDIAA
jgi:DNA-binding XRE family transcriptional regulator